MWARLPDVDRFGSWSFHWPLFDRLEAEDLRALIWGLRDSKAPCELERLVRTLAGQQHFGKPAGVFVAWIDGFKRKKIQGNPLQVFWLGGPFIGGFGWSQ